MARKVELARDQLATDMMSFMAKDRELAELVAKYLDFKREYHSSIAEQVLLTQPRVDSVLLTKRGFPIFGTSLADHLESFNLVSGIAFPLQLCITRLVELGLEEEGLFRLAAGSSKVKRLRADIEAGYASLSSLESSPPDHHVLTAIIKSYLRELPEPLMGAELYSDWCEAGKLEGEDKFDAIWNLLQHESLPRENYRNIQYLFKFLHEVTNYSDVNKMTASNLSIVITPNVMWECDVLHDTMDVTMGNSLAQVVETIILQYDWFFQNDDQSLDWATGLTTSSLGPCPPPTPRPESEALGFALASAGQTSISSPVPTTRERKTKGKKAPAPPVALGSPGPHHQPSSDHQYNTSPVSPPQQDPPSPVHLQHPPPLSPVTLRKAESPMGSPRAKSHESSPAYSRSKSMENTAGGARVASQPPNHPPPSPPSQATSVILDSSHSPSLYPNLPQEGETPHEKEKFPVPAPRFSKPALPNKPEGLSRNVSVKKVDSKNGWSSRQSTKDGAKESTNL